MLECRILQAVSSTSPELDVCFSISFPAVLLHVGDCPILGPFQTTVSGASQKPVVSVEQPPVKALAIDSQMSPQQVGEVFALVHGSRYCMTMFVGSRNYGMQRCIQQLILTRALQWQPGDSKQNNP